MCVLYLVNLGLLLQANKVCVWCYNPAQHDSADTLAEPQLMSECCVGAADVQGLDWLSENRLAVNLSSGDVLLYQLNNGETVSTASCKTDEIRLWFKQDVPKPCIIFSAKFNCICKSLLCTNCGLDMSYCFEL